MDGENKSSTENPTQDSLTVMGEKECTENGNHEEQTVKKEMPNNETLDSPPTTNTLDNGSPDGHDPARVLQPSVENSKQIEPCNKRDDEKMQSNQHVSNEAPQQQQTSNEVLGQQQEELTLESNNHMEPKQQQHSNEESVQQQHSNKEEVQQYHSNKEETQQQQQHADSESAQQHSDKESAQQQQHSDKESVTQHPDKEPIKQHSDEKVAQQPQVAEERQEKEEKEHLPQQQPAQQQQESKDEKRETPIVAEMKQCNNIAEDGDKKGLLQAEPKSVTLPVIEELRLVDPRQLGDWKNKELALHMLPIHERLMLLSLSDAGYPSSTCFHLVSQ